MANVMVEKYRVMRRLNFDKELSPYVGQKLEKFVDGCKQSRQQQETSTINHQTKKSWIPLSKNEIKVPLGTKGSNHVAVFDTNMNMVVKQYTSINTAAQAAMLIQRLGFSCEISPLSSSVLETNVPKSANDPSILMFGYRWLFMEDLRKSQFVVAEGDKPIIKKLCTVSSTIMQVFDSTEKAYEDWLNTRKNRVSLPTEDGESMQYFTEKFLDGSKMIDGITWTRITSEESENITCVKVVSPEAARKLEKYEG